MPARRRLIPPSDQNIGMAAGVDSALAVSSLNATFSAAFLLRFTSVTRRLHPRRVRRPGQRRLRQLEQLAHASSFVPR